MSRLKQPGREMVEAAADESHKMASLGVMAFGIVHELNNIIGGMIGHAELAQLHPERVDLVKRALEVVRENGQRSRLILAHLSDFAHGRTGGRAAVSVVEIVEQSLELTSRNLELDAVRVFRRYDSNPTVVCDPWTLRQLLADLLLDVSRRVHRDSELTVDVFDDGASGVCVRLGYRPAESAESRPHACEHWRPLAAVGRLITGMGGTMTTSEENGTRRIDLALPKDVESRGVSDGSAAGGPHVLVVDDEEVIGELLNAVLADKGYEVRVVRSGAEALEALRAQAFDAVILDLMMPGKLGGIEVLAEIRRTRPECRVVMMTGRPPDAELARQLDKADAHILKPFQCGELIETLGSLAG